MTWVAAVGVRVQALEAAAASCGLLAQLSQENNIQVPQSAPCPVREEPYENPSCAVCWCTHEGGANALCEKGPRVSSYVVPMPALGKEGHVMGILTGEKQRRQHRQFSSTYGISNNDDGIIKFTSYNYLQY